MASVPVNPCERGVAFKSSTIEDSVAFLPVNISIGGLALVSVNPNERDVAFMYVSPSKGGIAPTNPSERDMASVLVNFCDRIVASQTKQCVVKETLV